MFLSPTQELEDLGNGRKRLTLHPRPVAYFKNGWQRMDSTWQNGDSTFPHQVTAGLMVGTGEVGNRRIYPTRNPNVYIEVGAPYIFQSGRWVRVPFSAPTRSGATLTWSRPQADLRVTHAGHAVKLDIELKNGYVPPNNQFAFPIDLVGLTREGRYLLADSVRVLKLAPPFAYDAANPDADPRPVSWEIKVVNGQSYILFTLPDLTGFTRPVIDPTFTGDATPESCEDTTISQGINGANYGGSTVISAGNATQILRGIIRFDVSALVGKTINSATLRLWCPSESATTDRAVAIHRGLTDFYEGSKDGTAPSAGENASTWNYKNNNGSVAWAGGAGGVAGTEWETTATDTQTITNPNAFYTYTVTADVVAWAGGATNYGWWLIGDNVTNSRKRFSSSDETDPSLRPLLTVEYTEPGGSATAHTLALLGVG
jgi:hypothetical protein